MESVQHAFLCYTLGVTTRTAIKDVEDYIGIDSLSLRRDLPTLNYFKYETSFKAFKFYKNYENKKDFKKFGILDFFKDMLNRFGINQTNLTEMNKKEVYKMIKKYHIKKILNSKKKMEKNSN